MAEGGSSSWFCCCNSRQTETLIVISLTATITSLLWQNIVFAPIKLVAVFLHEFAHASATWLTCGKVSGIEVNENFGGVTFSEGGSRWFILSAGYTGSVVWGSFFILMTWNNASTRVAAVFFIVACVATSLVLRIKNKRMCGARCTFGLLMRIIVLLMACIPVALWIMEDYTNWNVHPLRWCMLSFGTVCTLHAVHDCLHDVLCHKVNNKVQGKSDAVMFAEEICCTPRFWGLLWSIISLLAVALALFGILGLTSNCSVI